MTRLLLLLATAPLVAKCNSAHTSSFNAASVLSQEEQEHKTEAKFAVEMHVHGGDGTHDTPLLVDLAPQKNQDENSHFDKDFVMSLRLMRHTIEGRHTASVGKDFVEIDLEQTHVWYRGQIEGDDSSAARITGMLKERGTGQNNDNNTSSPLECLHGHIHTTEGITWVLECQMHPRTGLYDRMILRKQADIPHVPVDLLGDGGCQKRILPNDTDYDEHMRSRRAPPQSTDHIECRVFLDADKSYFDQWKGPCFSGWTAATCLQNQIIRIAVKMVDVIHQADEIYKADTSFGNKVRLAIAGTYVQTSLTNTGIPDMTKEDRDTTLSTYRGWLRSGVTNGQLAAVRGPGTLKANEVCLNHLFVHVDYRGTLGVAYVGAMCNGNFAYNTGFTTSLSFGNNVKYTQEVGVTTHELGHNFGAYHDCCTTCDLSDLLAGRDQVCPGTTVTDGTNSYTFSPTAPRAKCVPYGTQTTGSLGGYVMYPSVSNLEEGPYLKKFSTCSQDYINAEIQERGHCFVEQDVCKYGGACCDSDNKLKASGTKCRDSDPTFSCQEAAYCDGVHPECPENKVSADGTYCPAQEDDPTVHGVCFEGTCSHPHTGYCSEFMPAVGWNNPKPGCQIDGWECVRFCLGSNDHCWLGSDWSSDGGCGFGDLFNAFKTKNGYGNRYSLFTNNLPSPYSGTCQIATVGSPCTTGGKEGTCLVSGKCEECTNGDCSSKFVTTTTNPITTTVTTTTETEACPVTSTQSNNNGNVICSCGQNEFCEGTNCKQTAAGQAYFWDLGDCPGCTCKGFPQDHCKSEEGEVTWYHNGQEQNHATGHALFGAASWSPVWDQDVAIASPADACQPIAAVNGGGIVIEKGGCKEWQKVLNAETSGASFALIYTEAGGVDVTHITCDGDEGCSDISIPILHIPRATGLSLVNAIATDSSLTVSLTCDSITTTTITTVTSTIGACPTGQYRDGSQCRTCSNVACSAGQYRTGTCQGQVNGYQCVACLAPGSATSFCPDGQYRTGTCDTSGNNFNCLSCTPSNGENGGATCASGSYITGSCSGTANTLVCQQCTAPGSTTASCPAGQWRSGFCSGSTNGYQCNTCSNAVCDAGSFREGLCEGTTDGYECTECPANTYKSGTNSLGSCVDQPFCGTGQKMSADSKTAIRSCSACNNGFYQDATQHREVTCKPHTVVSCPAGQYLSVSPSATVNGVCTNCLAGQFQPSENNNQGIDSCQPWTVTSCAPGEILDPAPSLKSDGACNTCPAGQYRDPADETCKPVTLSKCGPGAFLSVSPSPTNDGVCSTCSAGQYKVGNNAATSCIPQTPAQCGPGLLLENLGSLTIKQQCSDCPTGTFKNETSNATSCMAHPITECGPGEYVENLNSKTVAQTCVACPDGQYKIGTSQAGQCEEQPTCKQGERITAPTAIAKRRCETCLSGTYQVLESHQEMECTRQSVTVCARGLFLANLNSLTSAQACESCPDGTFSDSVDASVACTPQTVLTCGPGLRMLDVGSKTKAQSCVECEEGTFKAGTSNATNCLAQFPTTCGAGKYIMNLGSKTDQHACKSCPSGTFSTAGDGGLESCKSHITIFCPPGEYLSVPPSNVSDGVCSVCPTGTFQVDSSNARGLESCLSHQTTTCPDGLFLNPAPNSVLDGACGPCAAGTYQRSPDDTCEPQAVLSCSSGQFMATIPNATTDGVCSTCPDGQYSAKSNQFQSCVPQNIMVCGAGEKLANSGSKTQQQVCEECEVGTYQDIFNHIQASCKLKSNATCPSGEYVSGFDDPVFDLICKKCPLGTYKTGENNLTQVGCLKQPPISPCGNNTVLQNVGSTTLMQGCFPCADNEYRFDDENCAESLVTSCGTGSFLLVEPTDTADGQCSSCVVGTYQASPMNVGNASTCLNHTVNSCGIGQYLATIPSPAQDGVCLTCPAGSVQEIKMNQEGITSCIGFTTSAPTEDNVKSGGGEDDDNDDESTSDGSSGSSSSSNGAVIGGVVAGLLVLLLLCIFLVVVMRRKGRDSRSSSSKQSNYESKAALPISIVHTQAPSNRHSITFDDDTGVPILNLAQGEDNSYPGGGHVARNKLFSVSEPKDACDDGMTTFANQRRGSIGSASQTLLEDSAVESSNITSKSSRPPPPSYSPKAAIARQKQFQQPSPPPPPAAPSSNQRIISRPDRTAPAPPPQPGAPIAFNPSLQMHLQQQDTKNADIAIGHDYAAAPPPPLPTSAPPPLPLEQQQQAQQQPPPLPTSQPPPLPGQQQSNNSQLAPLPPPSKKPIFKPTTSPTKTPTPVQGQQQQPSYNNKTGFKPSAGPLPPSNKPKLKPTSPRKPPAATTAPPSIKPVPRSNKPQLKPTPPSNKPHLKSTPAGKLPAAALNKPIPLSNKPELKPKPAGKKPAVLSTKPVPPNNKPVPPSNKPQLKPTPPSNKPVLRKKPTPQPKPTMRTPAGAGGKTPQPKPRPAPRRDRPRSINLEI